MPPRRRGSKAVTSLNRSSDEVEIGSQNVIKLGRGRVAKAGRGRGGVLRERASKAVAATIPTKITPNDIVLISDSDEDEVLEIKKPQCLSPKNDQSTHEPQSKASEISGSVGKSSLYSIPTTSSRKRPSEYGENVVLIADVSVRVEPERIISMKLPSPEEGVRQKNLHKEVNGAQSNAPVDSLIPSLCTTRGPSPHDFVTDPKEFTELNSAVTPETIPTNSGEKDAEFDGSMSTKVVEQSEPEIKEASPPFLPPQEREEDNLDTRENHREIRLNEAGEELVGYKKPVIRNEEDEDDKDEFEPLYSYGKYVQPEIDQEMDTTAIPNSDSDTDDELESLFQIGGLSKKRRMPAVYREKPANESPPKRQMGEEKKMLKEPKAKPFLPPPPNIVVSPNLQLAREMLIRRKQREELAKQFSVEATEAMVAMIEKQVAEEMTANESVTAVPRTSQACGLPGAETQALNDSDSQKLKLKLQTETEEHYFRIAAREKLEKLIGALSKKVGRPAEEVGLCFDGQVLDGQKTPVDYGIEDDDSIEVRYSPPDATALRVDDGPAVKKVKLKLRAIDGLEHFFKIGANDELGKLLLAYSKKVGKAEANIKLVFDGELLDRKKTTTDYDLEDDDLIEVLFS